MGLKLPPSGNWARSIPPSKLESFVNRQWAGNNTKDLGQRIWGLSVNIWQLEYSKWYKHLGSPPFCWDYLAEADFILADGIQWRGAGLLWILAQKLIISGTYQQTQTSENMCCNSRLKLQKLPMESHWSLW
jgi:hypothetical protein